MIAFTRRATRQIADLRLHYEALERPEAVRNLLTSLEQISGAIEAGKDIGLLAPRPYPDLARPGWLWAKSGRYWIAYRRPPRPAIMGVFYETADIQSRL